MLQTQGPTQESTCPKCAHWSNDQWVTVYKYLSRSSEIPSKVQQKSEHPKNHGQVMVSPFPPNLNYIHPI